MLAPNAAITIAPSPFPGAASLFDHLDKFVERLRETFA
jgi:hypothetical protein